MSDEFQRLDEDEATMTGTDHDAASGVEVTPAKPTRRRHSVQEKRRLLEEARKPGQNMASVARRYGVSTSLLFGWRKAFSAGITTGVIVDEPAVPASEVKALRAQIQALERLVERKARENDDLKASLERLRPTAPTLGSGSTNEDE